MILVFISLGTCSHRLPFFFGPPHRTICMQGKNVVSCGLGSRPKHVGPMQVWLPLSFQFCSQHGSHSLFKKLTLVFHVSVLLLIMNFVITLSK